MYLHVFYKFHEHQGALVPRQTLSCRDTHPMHFSYPQTKDRAVHTAASALQHLPLAVV